MSYKIRFYPERCVACGACAVACMDQNDILMQGGPQDQMFRKVYQTEYHEDGAVHFGYFSSSCRHCDDAPCIEACPAGCLRKDPETGFTIYDNTECTGCRSCFTACPYGAPVEGTDGKMEKCDGCNERVKAGLQPACVSVCPYDALQLCESGVSQGDVSADSLLP